MSSIPALPARSASARRTTRLICRLTLLGLVWRLARYALGFPLWGDEAFLSLSFLTRDYAGLFHPLEYGQIVPLGYLWATLACTRLFGTSEWGLRSFSLVAGVLAMLLFVVFARRHLGRNAALLAVGVFAAAYAPMRYAVELKPYGFDLLIALLLLMCGAAVLERPADLARCVLLTLAAVLGVWCSYPAAFIAGGIGIVLAVSVMIARAGSLPGRMRQPSPDVANCRLSLIATIMFFSALAASFAAMYFLFARPHYESAKWAVEIPMWSVAFPPLDRPWNLPLWLLDTHAGEMLAYPLGGKHGLSAGPLLLAIVGAAALWRANRRGFVLLLLSPLALALMAAVMRRYPYGGGIRVMLFMAPAFCLLIGRGLAAAISGWIPRRSRPRAVRIAVVVLAGIALIGLIRDVVKPYKGRADLENRRVLRELARQSAAGEQWLIFNALEDVPHAPDMRRWGGSAARFRYYVLRYAPKSPQWSPPPESVVPAPRRRLLVLAYVDNKEPFPLEKWETYCRGLSQTLGPPRRAAHPLGDGEAIETAAFGDLTRSADDES